MATLLDRARAQMHAGNFAGAEADCRRVLEQAPDSADAHFLLAQVLAQRGAPHDAANIYRRMLEAYPNDPGLLTNLGIVLLQTDQIKDALAVWTQAAERGSAEALVNLGVHARARGQNDEAIAHFKRAIAVNTQSVEAHYNLGHTWQVRKRPDLAISSLEAALRLRPAHARATIRLAQVFQDVCDFAGFARLVPALNQEIAKGELGGPCAVTPWFALRLATTLHQQQAVARTYAAEALRKMHPVREQMLGCHRHSAATRRIRLGYLSSDFRDHALLHLTRGMYAHHDHSTFAISAYATTKLDDSIYARDLRAGVDSVIDLSDLSAADAARRIYGDDLDILVDLSGFAAYARPEILAARPAPILVSWLGWAGTLGGLCDYILADATVIPTEHFSFYDEAVVWLPNTYQMNDNAPPQSDARPSRQTEGLPDEAFIFCCFCGGEKIGALIFERWMRVLKSCQGSILWLFADSDLMQKNLRHAARSLGVDPQRLVFASFRAKSEHLARLSLADLFLDTAPYGGHTTASDCLWAGVPIITQIGDTFASRVGASLLTAVGLKELIADTSETYEDIARKLAVDRARYAKIRSRLASLKTTQPLFDTVCLIRDVERALLEIVARARAGRSPAHFAVPARRSIG